MRESNYLCSLWKPIIDQRFSRWQNEERFTFSQLCLCSVKLISWYFQVITTSVGRWVGGRWVGRSVSKWSVVGGSVVGGFNETLFWFVEKTMNIYKNIQSSFYLTDFNLKMLFFISNIPGIIENILSRFV